MHYAGEKELYSGLNWHIKPGERIGLIGDNGTGKTTLLRMAAGELEQVSGEVTLRKNARIGFLKQEIAPASDDTTVLQEAMKAWVRIQEAHDRLEFLYGELGKQSVEEQEHIYEEIHDLEKLTASKDLGSAESESRRILTGLGFKLSEIDKPMAAFSGGWQMRAHIARLLLEQPDLLMLDEPTNHLDLESIAWLEGFLESFPGAMVVVSHDRHFLDLVTTRTAWVHEKRLDTYATNYSGFLKEREQYEELQYKRWANQQEELAHHERFIDRFRAKSSKATLVQSRIKMVEKIERIELPQSSKKVRLRIPEPLPCGRNVLELRRVTKAYGDKVVLSDVSLRVEHGDKIALVGPNGAGKSTMLKICAGATDFKGNVDYHPKARLEYFSQHRVDTLDLDTDVLTAARTEGASQTDEQIRTLLGCFLFTNDDVFKPVRVLSGGEKSRLALARMMLKKGNLLLLDEPTNHLDINTREVLRTALSEFPGTVIMVSHDRHFIDGIATRIWEAGNLGVKEYSGNYTEYERQKAELFAAEEKVVQAPLAIPVISTPAGRPADKPALNKAEQAADRKLRAERRKVVYNEFREIEQRVEQMEKRLQEIHTLQADPRNYNDGLITPEILREAANLEKQIPALTEKWEALASEIESLKASA